MSLDQFTFAFTVDNYVHNRDIAGLNAVTGLVLEIDPISNSPAVQTGRILFSTNDIIINRANSLKGVIAIKTDTDISALVVATQAYLSGLASYTAPYEASNNKLLASLGIMGSLSYQGVWNATTNIPTLASGVGSANNYHLVNVAGTTNLDGINDWEVNDWAIFNGVAWQKLDNSELVQSVNSKTGVVVLSYADVGAEQAFSKNTAFNKNFGILASDVCPGIVAGLNDSKIIYVDKNRSDSYTANGSILYPYKGIQAAINASTSGTVIKIAPGSYLENITLIAGIYLVADTKTAVSIVGKLTVDYTGTSIIHNIILSAFASTIIDFVGAGSQKLWLKNCNINQTGATVNHAINLINSNSNSELQIFGDIVNVANTSSGNRAIYSSALYQGSVGIEKTCIRIADNIDNVAVELNGSTKYYHTQEEIKGTVIVNTLATCTLSLIGLYSTTQPVLTTNSAGATVVNSCAVSTAVSPAIAGAGIIASVGVVYINIGMGMAATLNGGYGSAILNASSLSLNGSLGTAITTVTANATLREEHSTVLCNHATSLVIRPPQASTCTGRVYNVVNISPTGNVVIDPYVAELINGLSTYTIYNKYEGVVIQSNGTGWNIISEINKSKQLNRVSIATDMSDISLASSYWSKTQAGTGAGSGILEGRYEIELGTTIASRMGYRLNTLDTLLPLWDRDPTYACQAATFMIEYPTPSDTYNIWLGIGSNGDRPSISIKFVGYLLTVVAGTPVLYAVNNNGAGGAATNILAGLNIFNAHNFAFQMKSGEYIKFIVDGVLKATHTTYLPTGAKDTNGHLFVYLIDRTDSGAAGATNLKFGFTNASLHYNLL